MSKFNELVRDITSYILIIALVAAAGVALYSLFGTVAGSHDDVQETAIEVSE